MKLPLGEGYQLSHQGSLGWRGPATKQCVCAPTCVSACVCKSCKDENWGDPFPPALLVGAGFTFTPKKPCPRAVDSLGPWSVLFSSFLMASLAAPLPSWTFPPVTCSWPRGLHIADSAGSFVTGHPPPPDHVPGPGTWGVCAHNPDASVAQPPGLSCKGWGPWISKASLVSLGASQGQLGLLSPEDPCCALDGTVHTRPRNLVLASLCPSLFSQQRFHVLVAVGVARQRETVMSGSCCSSPQAPPSARRWRGADSAPREPPIMAS